MSQAFQTVAAVTNELGARFDFREVELDALRTGEMLIDVVAVGLCHTDLSVRDGHLPFPLPGVLGHEGAGIVRAIGPEVSGIGVGDRVCVSFRSCGSCRSCRERVPSYCEQFMLLNFGGSRGDGSHTLRAGGDTLGGGFFGQSTFARQAIVHQRNVVKVLDGIPLEIAGPLGCGIQTGAGAVLRALDCPAGSSILITGGGSVGLAAVLAAVVRGLSHIVVAEPIAKRRELALELGATHVVDPLADRIDEQVRSVLRDGVDAVLDTTAHEKVLTEAVAALAKRGRLAMVGVPSDPDRRFDFSLLDIQSRGISLVGVVEGNADPQEFIPELMRLYVDGRFPFDRLITLLPFEDINEGVELQASGGAVKVVLSID